MVGTPVADLGPVVSSLSLSELDASNTAVSDLEPLRGLSQLRLLYLENTTVSDIDPLRALPSLECLNISGTTVADLSPLNRLPLYELYADRTRVASLAGLDTMPNLHFVQLDDSALTSLGTIELLAPAYLSVMRDPLDAEALLAINRLCQAGWAVSWDGGQCGDYCKIFYCGD
jgi:Leucine-rich repeat (LRR) protein